MTDEGPRAPLGTSPARLSPAAWVLTGLVRLYQLVVSPWLGPSCRFEPSCSTYAVDALRLHGGLRGSWLILRRLARCQPFCTGGYDPVPEPRRSRRRCSTGPHVTSDVVGPAVRVASSEVGEPVAAGSLGRGAPPC
jgi:putative membrane protein insertion efficiency factor